MQNKEKLIRRVKTARVTLLLVGLLTIVNTFSIATAYDRVFPFSCFTAQFVMLICSDIAAEEGIMAVLITGIVISAVIALIFILMWAGSKKKSGYMVAGLVLGIIDTVIMLVSTIAFFEVDLLLDYAFHVWIIADLILGISAAKQLKELPEPVTMEEATKDFVPEEIVLTEESHPIGQPVEKSRLILKAEHNGNEIEVRRSKGLTELIINGLVYAEYRVPIERDYIISAMVSGTVYKASFSWRKSTMYLFADGEQLAKKFRLI